MVCEDCDQEMTEMTSFGYLDSAFTRNGPIVLHGITILRCRCGESPVYPFLGRLVPLVNANPDQREFYWNRHTREWSIGSMEPQSV